MQSTACKQFFLTLLENTKKYITERGFTIDALANLKQ